MSNLSPFSNRLKELCNWSKKRKHFQFVPGIFQVLKLKIPVTKNHINQTNNKRRYFCTMPPKKKSKSDSLDGKVFCFTGFRDAELEGLIRAAGGQVAASVTKALTTVVCKTGAEDTKKVKDAEAKGLTIMTKEELQEMLGSAPNASSSPTSGPYFTEEFLSSFWDDSGGSDEVLPYPTDEDVSDTEKKLGYKLPAAYIELMRSQNGGTPRRTAHRTSTRTSWAADHVAMTSFFGIGSSEFSNSLCGDMGSEFWMDEWEYPKIGVYFADCPSGGHDMLALDYRSCGKRGEPKVVHVDQEMDYKITVLAKDFASFVKGLVDEEDLQD